MIEPQLAFDLADPPAPEPQPCVPIWRREPDHEDVSFEFRPATAPNERDQHTWHCYRIYELSRADYNRGLTDNDIMQLKRTMIEALSGASGGVLTERDWEWMFYFRIIDLCGEQCLDCWLE